MATRDPEKYALPEAQHQQIFDSLIRPALFEGSSPSERPVAVVFGGQPGAGKTAALKAAEVDMMPRGGAVIIAGDEFRSFHPKYAALLKTDDQNAAFYTDKDSGRWVEKALAYASANKISVIIEGTYRNPDVVASTMNRFRAAGYEIDARALAVNERFSQQGILHRYEEQRRDMGVGRMTLPSSHQAAYEGMPRTLDRIEAERLADRLTLYKRNAEVVYSNELVNGAWKSPPAASKALEQERSRPWTLDERKAFLQTADKIDAMLRAPGRHATAEQLQAATDLRSRADLQVVAVLKGGTPYAQGKDQVRADGLSPAAKPLAAQNRQAGPKPPASSDVPKGPKRGR